MYAMPIDYLLSNFWNFFKRINFCLGICLLSISVISLGLTLYNISELHKTFNNQTGLHQKFIKQLDFIFRSDLIHVDDGPKNFSSEINPRTRENDFDTVDQNQMHNNQTILHQILMERLDFIFGTNLIKIDNGHSNFSKINPKIIKEVITTVNRIPSWVRTSKNSIASMTLTSQFEKEKSYLKFFIGHNPSYNNFKYHHEPLRVADACDRGDVDLIIFVAADMTKEDRRNAIRETWGNVTLSHNITMAVMFVLGYRPEDKILQKKIYHESVRYGDIIQGNFYDSYSTITTKMLYGYRYAILMLICYA